MPPEGEGTEAGATTTQTGATATGTTQTQNGGDAGELTQQLTTERSANQLIKQFAKDRGLTVSQLIDQFKSAEDSQKTELQRREDAAKDWEKRYGETARELQAERAEKAVRDAAAQAGARADRLSSVYRLVREDVQYGEDGKPTNVAALIEQAQKDAPEFFQRVAGSGDGGKTGDVGQDPNANVNALIRQMAGH